MSIFKKVSKIGKNLTELHLLKGSLIEKTLSKYQGDTDNDKIEIIKYSENNECIFINKDNHFTGISSEAWNYHIGGYQVLHKYLKDRKGQTMEDPRHYCRVATAICRTIEIQNEIDKIYDNLENKM